MQAQVTELQAKMLKKIARSEFTCINGAEPKVVDETETYANDVIETPQDKGVFTSMLNAGLVLHNGVGHDAVVMLSDKGFEIYKAIR